MQLANTSGNPTRDSALSINLCQAAVAFALRYLDPRDGKVVLKHLQSKDADEFRLLLNQHFANVLVAKPASSRRESREAYWVAWNLRSSILHSSM